MGGNNPGTPPGAWFVRDWPLSGPNTASLERCVYKPPSCRGVTVSGVGTTPLPRSQCLPLMPAFGWGITDDWLHRAHPKAPACFNWTGFAAWSTVVYPTPVLRYPTVVIAAGRHTLNPNRTAETRQHWQLTDLGWSAAETEAAGVSALAGSPQPSSSALLCFAFAALMRLSDRPTEDHHAATHGFLRGSRVAPRVASYH